MRKISFVRGVHFQDYTKPERILLFIPVYLLHSFTSNAPRKKFIRVYCSSYNALFFYIFILQNVAVGIVYSSIQQCRHAKLENGEGNQQENMSFLLFIFFFYFLARSFISTVVIAFSLAVNSAPPSRDEVMKLERNEIEMNASEKNCTV